MKVVHSRRSRRLLIPAAFVLILTVIGVPELFRNGSRPGVRIVGPERLVFDWSQDACAEDDYPDLPVRAFRDYRGQVQLIISHVANRRMIGRDLNHLKHSCGVTLTSDNDGAPENFNDREWISSVYTRDGRNIVALVHDEYQGNLHPGQCPSRQYLRCWYNSITLATSTDGGRSFTQAPPPHQLVASLPYPYVPDIGSVGLFSPSNIVYNPADRYFYTLARVEQYRDQQVGTCVMRTRALDDPRSWRGWDGKGFAVRFVNTYRETVVDPAQHVCKPVAFDDIQKMSHSLTYNAYFRRFMVVGIASSPHPGGRTSVQRSVWGVYYSLSKDLVHWSERRLITETEVGATYRCGDRNPISYPAVLDPRSRSRNFSTVGKRADLYFTRFNYKNCEMNSDRDLVRVPIEFSR